MNITRAFELSKNASTFSDCNIKVGSVIMYKNKVISVGYNINKSNPIQKRYNKYRTTKDREFDIEKHDNGLHSEHMALRNAVRLFNGDLSKCSIFVYSAKKNGSTRLSRPCKACYNLLKDYGIKNMYYTTENGYNYERIERS